MHRRRLGISLRVIPTIKRRIKGLAKPHAKASAKRKRMGTKRQVNGHNVFISKQIEAKRAAAEHWDARAYRSTLAELHAEWSASPAEFKEQWRKDADKGYHTAKVEKRADMHVFDEGRQDENKLDRKKPCKRSQTR